MNISVKVTAVQPKSSGNTQLSLNTNKIKIPQKDLPTVTTQNTAIASKTEAPSQPAATPIQNIKLDKTSTPSTPPPLIKTSTIVTRPSSQQPEPTEATFNQNSLMQVEKTSSSSEATTAPSNSSLSTSNTTSGSNKVANNDINSSSAPQSTQNTSNGMKFNENQNIESEFHMMMQENVKLDQNFSQQRQQNNIGHISSNIPTAAVTNGYSDSSMLGVPHSGIAGSLSHIPMSAANMPLMPPNLGIDSALLSNNISMLNEMARSLSGGITFPPNPMLNTHANMSSTHDGNFNDMKMAGLETNLGFNYGSGHAGALAQEMGSVAMMPSQMQLGTPGSMDVASLQGYINVQRKALPLEVQKLAAAQSASLSKSKTPTPKNLSSWSSLAQPNAANPSPSVKNANDSFAQFRKAAKEKAAKKQQMMEQQEIRRQQKEAVEKERARVEQDREKARREEELLDRAREVVKEKEFRNTVQESPTLVETSKTPNVPMKVTPSPSVSPSTPVPTPQPSTPVPAISPHPPTTTASTVDSSKLSSDRDRQKLREQERRRREAMAGKIDMNHQSDLMAEFEEQCGK